MHALLNSVAYSLHELSSFDICMMSKDQTSPAPNTYTHTGCETTQAINLLKYAW